jgi:hypothetical protein
MTKLWQKRKATKNNSEEEQKTVIEYQKKPTGWTKLWNVRWRKLKVKTKYFI